MSKLEHLKMIERLNADEHYFIAEKIAKKGVNSFNKDEDEHLIYYDLIEELKADIELLDKDISNYYYRLRAIQRQLKKINQAFA